MAQILTIPFILLSISCRLYLQAVLNHHHGAWLARNQDQNQWLQVKFAQRVEIRRVATQGRPNSDQWVKSYKLNYSSDGLLFYQYQTNKNQTVSSFADALTVTSLFSQRSSTTRNLTDSARKRNLSSLTENHAKRPPRRDAGWFIVRYFTHFQFVMLSVHSAHKII